MAPAADKLMAALEATPIQETRIPVVSNVDVNPHSDAASIRATLAKQLTNPVQWEKTMNTMLDKGLESATEVGPGKVIYGIMKRVNKTFPCDNFDGAA